MSEPRHGIQHDAHTVDRVASTPITVSGFNSASIATSAAAVYSMSSAERPLVPVPSAGLTFSPRPVAALPGRPSITCTRPLGTPVYRPRSHPFLNCTTSPWCQQHATSACREATSAKWRLVPDSAWPECVCNRSTITCSWKQHRGVHIARTTTRTLYGRAAGR
jgi:hypothetical protein